MSTTRYPRADVDVRGLNKAIVTAIPNEPVTVIAEGANVDVVFQNVIAAGVIDPIVAAHKTIESTLGAAKQTKIDAIETRSDALRALADDALNEQGRQLQIDVRLALTQGEIDAVVDPR